MGTRFTSPDDKARVLIAGGGVGAMEAALALQDLAADELRIDIYSPRVDFFYRPFSVTAPYRDPRELRVDMDRIARRCGAQFHCGSIVSVDTKRRTAQTQRHEEAPYDYLIAACGARMLRGVPGAVNFWGIADDPRIHDVIRDLKLHRLRHVVFTMPGGNSWMLPMYELALLAESELSENDATSPTITIVTPEEAPLKLFGVEASRKVIDLLSARKVNVVAGATPIKFEHGHLSVVPGRDIEADAVISLPRLEGRKIAGLPHGRYGFIPVDDRCRIYGPTREYAIGDVTNFPVKQGGIAAQQADVAADSIVADMHGEEPTLRFDPILRGVLFTGGEPLYLSGFLAGGHGESSIGSSRPLWEGTESDKIVAKHLTSFLRAEFSQEPRSSMPR